MELAYWEEKYYFEDNDVIIIGGGIVGLSTAIFIKSNRPNLKVLVLERSTLPSGASTKNAGFACFGSITELMADANAMSRSDIIDIIRMRWEGLRLLKSNVNEDAIQFRNRGGVELLDKRPEAHSIALNNLDQYNDLVFEAIGLKDCFSIVDQKISNSFYHKAIYNNYEGELNPMNMMASLQKKAINLGVNILYGLEVTHIKSNQIYLKDKVISAKSIAVCTNGLTRKLLPEIALQAVRNQVIVTEVIENNPLHSCFHFDQGYIYFREIDGRILIGGARNIYSEQETTDQFGQTDNIINYLHTFVEEKILDKSVNIDYQWSGILGVGDSKKPIVEELHPGLFVGVRLGGMGVAIGSGVGKQLATLILQSAYS